MDAQRLNFQVATGIGGNTRMVRRKDMEHLSGLMEKDTLGSGCRMSHTGMDYTHGQVELYIKDNGNKITEKVMHIGGGQVAMSIMDSIRMITGTERESNKKMDNYMQSNTKKVSASATMKYQ